MKYRPEIDGMRALAVLPVVLFHAGFERFGGGYTGVDVFFVISGWLITSILAAELAEGRFSIAAFYERRARRILPALFCMMAASIPLAWALLLPFDFRRFCDSLASVTLFGSNMLFLRESGYFDSEAELKPLLHTWSLAVEEQFYVLFPLLLWLAWRLGRRRVTAALAVVALASLAFAQWGTFAKPAASFFLLPTRAWELLVGALAALHGMDTDRAEPRPLVREAFSLVGLALVVGAVFSFDRTTRVPGVAALVPTIGAALVLLHATPATLAGRLLGQPLPVGIGLLSYSAYLWHQPLFAFARHATDAAPDKATMAALCVATFALAWVSWRFVERPFRDRRLFGGRAVFGFATAGSAAFLALGMAGHRTDGFERLYVEHRLDDEQRRLYALLSARTGRDLTADMVDDGGCIFWSRNVDAAFVRRFDDCAKRLGSTAVVVLGDSHAMNIYNAVARAGTGKFVVGVTQPGCRPHATAAGCPYDSFARFVAGREDRVGTVVFHQSGAHLMLDETGRADSPRTFEKGARMRIAANGIDAARDYLRSLPPAVRAVWLGPFAEARTNPADFRRAEGRFRMNETSLGHFAALDDELKRRLGDGSAGVRYVSLAELVPMDAGFLRIGDCITFRDRDHLSRCGEAIVGERLRPAFGSGGPLSAPGR